ncbi:cytochrome P450 [Phanerochaete sordida]|uniref:Cytochrome P450 n=1 Tax=Phanerochaete sordida TaxID=48140 RepID=A0A9P3G055_9APHY|nr:cytochrome P450 [Phanerochaete sordida]
MALVLWLLAAAVAYHGVSRAVQFRKLLAQIRHHPGLRLVANLYGAVSFFVPFRIPYIIPGPNFLFKTKHALLARHGLDVVTSVSSHPLRAVFVVADPAILRDMTAARSRFPKPVAIYGTLSLYGPNIVASEHDEWKRYRRICSPSFSERNNRLVWEETVRVMTELFDLWADKDEIVDDDVVTLTVTIALYVISSAGFGQQISWKVGDERPEGYEMSFKDAIYYMSTGVFIKVATPAWLLNLGLTEKMRKTNTAFKELGMHMADMIKKRRESKEKEERFDLLNGLLDANEEEADLKLTDVELMGNIFIFLIAGHETSGHTLCYALALLALYPDEQEKLYQHIRTIQPPGELPRYEDLRNYTYAQDILSETLRMYPSVVGIPKIAADDTVVQTTNAAGETVDVFIPKGADIVFDTPGLHYNPKYWSDPYTFSPERFTRGDWPRDAYLPFSGGARACLGRRFAEIEIIAVLVLMVSRFTIHMEDDARRDSETETQRRDRLLKSSPGLTLTPKGVSLTFRRRK